MTHDSDNDREPDLRGPAIVVTGNVLGGYEFTGPFETIDAAAKWHENDSLAGALKIGCTVALLKPPKYLTG